MGERTGRPRILGIAEGDDPSVVSGIPQHLFDALGRRFPVERLSFAPRGAERLALAAASFRPSRQRWRSEFHNSTLAHRVLSRNLRRRLRQLGDSFDITLQVLGWLHGQPRPYAIYVDQTRLMAERGWPQWMPIARHRRTDIVAREREMYASAAHLFTMGSSALESLVEDYGVDRDRVTVVGGGLSFEEMPAVRERPPDPVILFVGRDFERKGGEVLLEAFKQVREELPDAALHIVGTRRPFREPGIVSWGRVASRERIGQLYGEARVFCLPSLYEPFGLVLIEAMAYGLPCVGTAVQSIPWILDDGRAGMLVPPRDAESLADSLIQALSDDELAGRLSSAGRRRVEQELTWDRVVDRMTPGLMRIAATRD